MSDIAVRYEQPPKGTYRHLNVALSDYGIEVRMVKPERKSGRVDLMVLTEAQALVLISDLTQALRAAIRRGSS